MVFEENMAHNPVCVVCNCAIDDAVHRVLIFQNAEKTPIVKRYHFFFPCWDFEEISKNESDSKIANAGLSYEKTFLNDPAKIKSLQRNSSVGMISKFGNLKLYFHLI